MSWAGTLPERKISAPRSAFRRQVPADWLAQRVSDAPATAFLLLTAIYSAVVAVLSSAKLLWLDELITLHIARLGSPQAIWVALKAGADPNPPLMHLLVSLSRSIFGEHELALRAPAALGYWAGLLTLFVFLRRRLPVVWALCGTVASMTMAAFDYSYESRSYGILYGSTMSAFFCWTVSADTASSSRKRTLALFGMSCSLLVGLCTNYFAVLAFVPVVAGEVTYTVRRWQTLQSLSSDSGNRQVAQALRSPVWVALLFALTPLWVFYPLIRHAVLQFSPYAFNHVSAWQIPGSYTEMVEAMLLPLLGLFAYAVWSEWQIRSGAVRHRAVSREQSRTRSFIMQPVLPFHEQVGVAALMAYPVFGYLAASAYGGMFSPRLVIPVCLGFAIAGSVIAFRLFAPAPGAGSYLLCFCLAWFCARELYVCYTYRQQKRSFAAMLERIPEAERLVPPGSLIAVPDPLLALPLQHYAGATLQRQLVFPLDFAAIRQYRGDDSPEQNLWAGRGSWYTLPILTLAELQQHAGYYLIISGDRNWLLQELRAHQYTAERLPVASHAGDLGGFTPLCRGIPAFYRAQGHIASTSTSVTSNTTRSSKAPGDMPGPRAGGAEAR